MRVSLVPDRLFETYEEITPEYLQQRGIRLLLSDLDYTLAPKYVPHPDDRVREWLRRMEEGGVQVMILSNNRSSHRVETFCRELGIPYVGHAQKPRTTGFHRAMEQAGVTAAETAMMGDKLLTDMLGANLAGVLALMVEPAGGPKGGGSGGPDPAAGAAAWGLRPPPLCAGDLRRCLAGDGSAAVYRPLWR